MQTITIAGKLGRDAELRRTQSDDAVCGFTVAVDVRQGREKTTNWWRVSLWGKRGEALAPYLLKGASVTVIGEFSLGDYEGKPQFNIRASEIALQGGRGEREPDGSRGAPAQTAKPATDWQDDLSDDIPFARNDGIW